MNIHEDEIVLYYISELNKIVKQKKRNMKFIDGKPTIDNKNFDDAIEKQIRQNLNDHLKKNYPQMAYFVTARVKVKSIPDGCGLENKGTIVKSVADERIVKLDNGKEYQYNVVNLELLDE